jgi:hypothetical protein
MLRLILFPGDELMVAPGRVEDVRCVARTAKGARCANLLMMTGPNLVPADAYSHGEGVWVQVASMARFSDADVARWRAQRCSTHAGAQAVDATPVEWVKADLRGVHADLV